MTYCETNTSGCKMPGFQIKLVPDFGEAAGGSGWTPVLAIAFDGERRVQQVIDWTGGSGEKPETGLYVGETGFVSDISEAVDIRGGQGISEVQPKSVIRCSGYIADRSVPANSWTETTPIYESGDNMIEGNKFVAHTDGLYLLHVSPGVGNTSGTIRQAGIFINKNNEWSYTNVNYHTGTWYPSITAVQWLDKGDYLTYVVHSNAAQTTIHGGGIYPRFTFALL